MKQFLSVEDVVDVPALIRDGLRVKRSPRAWHKLGRARTLGLIFMNPSLRTRLSMYKAAMSLGMQVVFYNDQDGWGWEIEDGITMSGEHREHVREAAGVISRYCDIVGIRSVRGAQDEDSNRKDILFDRFAENAEVPVVNMQNTLAHPLQSLADLMTIEEHRTTDRPKVVLTWVPDTGRPPPSVANSLAEWVGKVNAELVVTHPIGFELEPRFAGSAELEPNQSRALEGADFVYAKSWHARTDTAPPSREEWMITQKKMTLTNAGKFMHPLPIRRNLVVSDDVMDSSRSIVLDQAANREYAAQIVLKKILESIGD